MTDKRDERTCPYGWNLSEALKLSVSCRGCFGNQGCTQSIFHTFQRILEKIEFFMKTELLKLVNELHWFTNQINFEIEEEGKSFINYISDFTGKEEFPFPIIDYGNRPLYRAVNYFQDNSMYKQKKHFWLAPIDLIPVGRLNFRKEEVFYCSEEIGTAIAEISVGSESKYPASIKVKPNRNLRLISMGLGNKYSTISNGITYTTREKALDIFIRDKFRQKIDPEEESKYFATAIIANLFLPNKSIDGIIYPSCSTNLLGENIGLKKEILGESLVFEEVRTYEMVSKKSDFDFKVKCLQKASDKENGEYNWEPIKNCKNHIINQKMYLE